MASHQSLYEKNSEKKAFAAFICGPLDLLELVQAGLDGRMFLCSWVLQDIGPYWVRCPAYTQLWHYHLGQGHGYR